MANTTSPNVIEDELHTALHEMVHVFGGILPASYPTVNATGQIPSWTTLVNVGADEAYQSFPTKMRTMVTTPRVLNFTRTHFSCPSAIGFPLEDVPLGKGSHWEARVAGPELMSYGAGTGQVYISDLTLGYLEDTGHYIVRGWG